MIDGLFVLETSQIHLDQRKAENKKKPYSQAELLGA
jgi:hypothetical protein